MSRKKRLLEYLKATATADSEADVERLMDLFHPAPDRDEAGNRFKDVMGYNPITHYDMQDVIRLVDGTADKLSSKGRHAIEDHKDDIVTEAYRLFNERRESYFKDCIADVLNKYVDGDDRQIVSSYLSSVAPVFDEDDDEELEYEPGDDDEDGSLADIMKRADGDDSDLDDLGDLDIGGDDDDDESFTFNDGEDED